jgi:prephenate dehydrogenase
MVNMEAGFSLTDSTIGIFGLGLMGGSLAMSLKGHCARIVGFDSHLPALEAALSKNIIDRAESDLVKFLNGLDLLILATPVPVILNLLQQLPSLTSRPCIILDIGSTKREIIEAMCDLPVNFDPLGGHPICGKEKLGLENADAALYKNAPFVVIPLARTTEKARSAAAQIMDVIGAHCIEMTAQEHDRILASTSHLPFLLSSAFVLSMPQNISSFIGPGFKSTSRLAGTPSSMMLGVLQSNRENVLNALHALQSQLVEIESALSLSDFSRLENILNASKQKYQTFIQ